MSGKHEVTQILQQFSGKADQELLYPLVYDNLHEIAEKLFARERANHTLQPTILVNEAYMNLVDIDSIDWQGRTHFFAVGAKAIRRVLVHHARSRDAIKRGGAVSKVDLEEGLTKAEGKNEMILGLDEALGLLAEQHERQAQVVEMKFFGGMKMQEIADELGVSIKTVEVDWKIAKSWLKDVMESEI